MLLHGLQADALLRILRQQHGQREGMRSVAGCSAHIRAGCLMCANAMPSAPCANGKAAAVRMLTRTKMR